MLEKQQIIDLLAVYYSEWQHRDDILWSQMFKLFYANLIVTILPYIAEAFVDDFPAINPKIFPVLGIVMTCAALYIGIGYAVRLQASSDT